MDDDNVPAIAEEVVLTEQVVDGDVCDVIESNSVIVTREDRLLIQLTTLCNEANVPLYLADDIIEIFRDETERSLILNTSILSKWRTFMKCLCSCFPTPQTQTSHIGIEGMNSQDQNY